MLGYGNHLGPLEELRPETDIRFTPGFMDALLPRNIYDYAHILENLLEKYETRCFLVNAGWHGGQTGQGSPLFKSEESTVIDSMHHCADWRPLGSLGLSIPAEKSDTVAAWNPEERWPDCSDFQSNLSKLISLIADELQRTSDPERWLRALEIECN